MKHAITITALGLALAVGACANSQKKPDSTQPMNANAAGAKQKWEGTWSGSWDGACSGSIKVSDVQADSAHVLYSWGSCGNAAPGTYEDRTASIQGDTLTVHLYGSAEATYSHIDETTLKGRYERPSDGSTATGTFTREG